MNQKSSDTPGNSDNTELVKRGKAITQATFQALSGELQKSMKAGGVEEAISYCHVNALPLTDRLAEEQNAIIKRTSLKFRNPKNAPSNEEQSILHEFQAELDAGEDMKPKLVNIQGQDIFYAPIVTQELCLKCHGPKESIPVYDLILSKYPDDLATGYKAGDLRGMWSVVLLPAKEE
jgi:hypothetical protein